MSEFVSFKAVKDIYHLDRSFLKKQTRAVFLSWEISLKIGDKGTCLSSCVGEKN